MPRELFAVADVMFESRANWMEAFLLRQHVDRARLDPMRKSERASDPIRMEPEP